MRVYRNLPRLFCSIYSSDAFQMGGKNETLAQAFLKLVELDKGGSKRQQKNIRFASLLMLPNARSRQQKTEKQLYVRSCTYVSVFTSLDRQGLCSVKQISSITIDR